MKDLRRVMVTLDATARLKRDYKIAADKGES